MLLCFCASGKFDHHVLVGEGGGGQGSYDFFYPFPTLTHAPLPQLPCVINTQGGGVELLSLLLF